MTERMQFLWCERWPLIFWAAFGMLFHSKSLMIWCLALSGVVLLTKMGKGKCYFVAFLIGFPLAVTLA